MYMYITLCESVSISSPDARIRLPMTRDLSRLLYGPIDWTTLQLDSRSFRAIDHLVLLDSRVFDSIIFDIYYTCIYFSSPLPRCDATSSVADEEISWLLFGRERTSHNVTELLLPPTLWIPELKKEENKSQKMCFFFSSRSSSPAQRRKSARGFESLPNYTRGLFGASRCRNSRDICTWK